MIAVFTENRTMLEIRRYVCIAGKLSKQKAQSARATSHYMDG